MKCVPANPELPVQSRHPIEHSLEKQTAGPATASSLPYQLVTIVAALLLLISAAVPW